MSDTILVPTDGSPESERALDIAIPVAKALGLSITLFWCWEGLPELESSVGEDLADQITQRETTDRASFVEDLASRRLAPAGVEAEIASGAGTPAQEIVKLGEERQVRYIALSTHGRSGFKRWRLGSVTDRVLRETTRDALVVAPRVDVELSPTISKIVIPLDGSDRARIALEDALPVAKATGAEVLLVRAYIAIIATTPIGAEAAYVQANEAALAGAQAYLDALAAEIDGPTVKTSVYSGDASAAIIASAEDADLIVMSSHGRGGLARMALGSVTDAVIRGSGKPVLVARSGN